MLRRTTWPCYNAGVRARLARKPKTKAAYHHGNLRRSLVEAALTLASAHGARSVSLNEAARLAGVSGAAPYRHFADKEALLAAAAEVSFVEFRAALHARRASSPDPLEGLLRQGEAYVRYAQKHPERLDLMFSMGFDFARSPALAEASAAAFEELQSAVRALVPPGLLAAEAVEATAYQVWFLAHGAATMSPGHLGTTQVMSTLRDGVVSLLRGKRAGPPSRAAG